ncbi:hypothetical protein [Allonocardiopsis opalescens]|uniref:Uncharacterized protein n=1 Tax=Allonocardiopsis opalescens TaxID=1144618 RepID=A0A2T0PW67_9ACTN|nr:hypothetical protein [Allonocardiopsis opalescens]PRX95779.1 hypothetical protein CLV72_109393 [Allonocardiopsis opalescens]
MTALTDVERLTEQIQQTESNLRRLRSRLRTAIITADASGYDGAVIARTAAPTLPAAEVYRILGTADLLAEAQRALAGYRELLRFDQHHARVSVRLSWSLFDEPGPRPEPLSCDYREYTGRLRRITVAAGVVASLGLHDIVCESGGYQNPVDCLVDGGELRLSLHTAPAGPRAAR